jgi:hypothetical protein
MFKNLKVGDKVYMAPQRRFGGNPRYVEISAVGRKYGYFKLGWMDHAFLLTNGESHHAEGLNARMNQVGFDIYPSEENYRQKMLEGDNFFELQSRLFQSKSFRLRNLPPSVVSKILDVLDEAGIKGE